MRRSLISALSLCVLFSCAEADSADAPDVPLAATVRCPPSSPSPTHPAGVTYEVVDLATGLLRTAVVKRDPARGLCTRIVLVHGGARTGLSVRVDAPQVALERAWIDRDLGRCDDVSPAPPPGAVVATAAAGTIFVRNAGQCLLDLDLTLRFPKGEPWVPDQEPIRVRGLDSSFACLVR